MNAVQNIPYCRLEEALPDRGEYVLLKTGRVTPWDRWSILGWDPWLRWVPSRSGDPFVEWAALLREVKHHYCSMCEVRGSGFNIEPGTSNLEQRVPILMGAFAYDTGRAIEAIPATARQPLDLPDAIFFGFRRYLIADERERRAWSVQLETLPSPPRFSLGERARVRGENNIGGRTRRSAKKPVANFSPDTYRYAVEQIRQMIAAGDLYQVNLSQQIEAHSARSAAEIFRAALAANPAPMMALVDAGDFQLISTSPERLLAKRGDRLISRPIKGTRPRGATPEEDAALREELLTHPKDNAELAMIVDLVRNDLGRVAVPGSVTVTERSCIESYANVHQMLATITGACVAPSTGKAGGASPSTPHVRLLNSRLEQWSALLRAVFPGGSVTGCPKVQAMRVIEQIEGARRGFYCGSIGYIAANGDGDWNIAIRTITKVGHRAVFNIGGAVVYDSDPAQEYAETLHKGRTMFAALQIPSGR